MSETKMRPCIFFFVLYLSISSQRPWPRYFWFIFVSLFSLCINTTTFLTKLDRPRLVRHMELFSESSCFHSSPNPMSPVEADWFHLIPLEPVDEVGCFSLLFPGEEIHTWLGSSLAAHNDEISLVAMSVEFIKSNIDPLVPSGLKYQDEKRALNSRIKKLSQRWWYLVDSVCAHSSCINEYDDTL